MLFTTFRHLSRTSCSVCLSQMCSSFSCRPNRPSIETISVSISACSSLGRSTSNSSWFVFDAIRAAMDEPLLRVFMKRR